MMELPVVNLSSEKAMGLLRSTAFLQDIPSPAQV